MNSSNKDKIHNGSRKIIYTAIGIIIFMAYMSFLFRFLAQAAIDSDYANLLLEAHDIADGNIFLKGWNLTGVSFITTDLPYFIIGDLVAGISISSYILAITLMFSALVVSGFLLIKDKCNWKYAIFFVAIAGVPCSYWASVVRAHTGCIVLSFLGLLVLYKSAYSNKNVMKMNIAACLLFALAVMGDAVSIITIIGPIFAVAFCHALSGYSDSKKIEASDKNKMLVSGLSAIIGFVLDKMYFVVGGANKNSFLGTKTFVPFEEYWNKIYIYLNSLFGMFDAGFMGRKLFSFQTLFFFMRSSVIITGTIIILSTISHYVKGHTCDYINLILSLGFTAISILFIVTDISVDVNSGRYFAYAPVLFSIVLIRHFGNAFCTDNRLNTMGITIFVCSLILIMDSISPMPPASITYNEISLELVKALKDNGLENGYGDFWTASHTTVYSQSDVSVRAVISDGNGIGEFKWFCKDSWYDEYANFVIFAADDSSIFSIRSDTVVSAFGQPKKIVSQGTYHIYIYNYDLSKMLVEH